MNILFLQLEIIPNCPPHMGMCLFVEDLQKDGINCDTYIVNFAQINHIIPIIEKGKYSLICLDSVFTIEIIRFLQKQFPNIPILVGGINAVSLLVHSDIQYAIFGPGRGAIKTFIQQYFGSKEFHNVPNLFFKQDNKIMYSDKTQHWNLEKELFPYKPFLNWNYVGNDRESTANFSDVSIIAGTGCTYASSLKSIYHFFIRDTIHSLGYNISDNALKRLEEIFNKPRHGCSFCIFQYQSHTGFAVEKTVELLLEQARYLNNTYNVRSFQIQTENPLPFLNNLITALNSEDISFDKLSIRTRPDFLMRHLDKLFDALNLAQENDFSISIEQIGFESFYEKDLKLFNKNINVKTNEEVIRILREIKQKYGQHVCIDIGHGLIVFHPWTTVESIRENVKFLAQCNDIFPHFFAANLILYSEFLPIYPKIKEEGLERKSEYLYGMDYKIKDPFADKAYEIYRILKSHFGGNIPVQKYLECLDMIRNYSIDEILYKVFYLVPVD